MNHNCEMQGSGDHNGGAKFHNEINDDGGNLLEGFNDYLTSVG